MSWRKLSIDLAELCIDTTLRCGQSFRWRRSADGVWSCALQGRLISLRQDAAHLHYLVHCPAATATSSASPGPEAGQDDIESFLKHYLNLEPNLSKLYEQWSSADSNFKKKAPKFTGVRILKQDAWEALVGFICSSNNNISRISQMMEKLCTHYGPLVGHVDGAPFYDMPSPESLQSSEVEGHLRELGFGYRAKYLHRTAIMIAEQPKGWLDGLRNPESPVLGGKRGGGGEMQPGGRQGYREAHEQLLALQGVGAKVADCVCLMGLGWGEAVPVDTHVWQIAVRDYKFGRGKHRSLTKATYDAVGDHFRTLWGREAGWAHSVLFAADLRVFAERLETKVEVKEEVVETKESVIIKIEETVSSEAIFPNKKRNAGQREATIEEKTTVRSTRLKRKRGS